MTLGDRLKRLTAACRCHAGRVEGYRQAAYELRSKMHTTDAAGKWNGPISFHGDGTVMALSILLIRRRPAP